ncbi:4-hydroxy-3-polyprenylbenzoate decarboxylase [Lentzea xinjiangensis]|uniref:Pyrrole-2-carboxylic acid decarboxylase n=1 Tax=Lentzea xinjiangensis TaxID=402600 RepID=A0A1H9NK32_9PSEU|nr:UbiD family decarboxylase [Lentzea xinjiangensis]SER36296.1 4-hydroxy-3-polyprenylbenzoate decarboxylase [Lentzea xinjiangensis]
MPIKDLRDYLHALEDLGDLRRIADPVDPDLEAAAITRYSTENELPAPLFENLAGVAAGFRVFGAPASHSSSARQRFARVSLALGLPLDATAAQIVEHLVKARTLAPVRPRLVAREDAPCKENVLSGADASFASFPIPRLHLHDGGRYVNSWGVVITKTPDGSWTNWAITRVMLLDDRRMVGLVLPSQQLGQIHRMWADIGQPMPYALVQGGHPGVPYVGGLPIPRGVDESGYLGALLGEPVDLVAAESVDLEVPATAEVVIEGTVSLERTEQEGPFGEYAGFMSAARSAQPVFSVDVITHRDAPIWPIVPEGRPVDETHLVSGVGHSAQVTANLTAAGLPVTMAWLVPRTASHWMFVTVDENWRDRMPGVTSAELCHRIGEVLTTTPSGRIAAEVFVVDDDIDPANDRDVMWALGTRFHPSGRREEWHGPILPLLASYSNEERQRGSGPVVVRDGLLAAAGEGRPVESSFANSYPEAYRERAKAVYQKQS